MQTAKQSLPTRSCNGPTWLERMRGVGVLAVAKALGLDVQPARGSSGGSFRCPACNAQRRHTKTSDRRAAAGVRNDGRGWRCFQCDVSGDALNLVAYALRGTSLPNLSDVGTADVRAWCERWLGLGPTSASSPSSAASRPPPFVEPPKPPRYPPVSEVRALWAACKPVTDMPEVADWLLSKRLDPQAVADGDLARALHPGVPLPRWTRFRVEGDAVSDWCAGGYVLIARLVDTAGNTRSVLARSVRPGREPKSRAAGGFERRGLVLACPLALQVLALGAKPAWWPTDRPMRVEVAEGEKKWMMRATLRQDELAPACLGIESGSWTAELAARIPDKSSVFIATDPNEAGAKYATAIVRSLAPRIASGAVRAELHPYFRLIIEKDGPTVKVAT